MSTNGNNEPNSASKNEDLLKSLRHLNSCITLTSVKDNPTDPKSPSSDSGSSSSEGPPDFPQLRGVSIQGHTKGSDTLISKLLGTKKKEEEEAKKEGEPSNKGWLNEWSKRCLSISFSKPSNSEAYSDEEDDEEEGINGGVGGKNQSDGGSNVGKGPLIKNGITSSNSASNSRDSLPKASNLSKPAEQKFGGSVSINSILSLSTSVSFAPVKPPVPPDSEKKVVPRTGSEEKTSSTLETEKRRVPSPDERLKEASSTYLLKKEENSSKVDHSENSALAKLALAGISISSTQVLSNEPLENHKKEKTTPEINKEPELLNQCLFCFKYFATRSELTHHTLTCEELNEEANFQTPKKKNQVARKKSAKSPSHSRCVSCNITFSSVRNFENHLKKHATDKLITVSLERHSSGRPNHSVENSEDSDSRSSIASSGSNQSSTCRTVKTGDDKGLKLTFKISNNSRKGKRGRKPKVHIVNAPEKNMIESQLRKSRESSPLLTESQLAGAKENDNEPHVDSMRPSSSGSACSSGSGSGVGLGMPENREQEVPNNSLPTPLSQMNPPANPGISPFNAGQGHMNFISNNVPNERPPSVYQPQFESFTGDWFNEYDSGSRIAAAMSGSGSENSQPNNDSNYSANIENNTSPFNHTQDQSNRNSQQYSSAPVNPNLTNINKDQNGHSDASGGLFSQAVLGNEPPPPPSQPPSMSGMSESRQSSFEQLCLNDSFGGQGQNDSNMTQPGMGTQNYNQGYNPNQQSGGDDLLSELAYLNNGQQLDHNRPSSMENERSYSSHGSGSNSGTPTSSGHPTPPPTDTSFRALTTSPLNSPNSASPLTSGGPTPPMQPVITPPLQNSTSPLQQMSQMGQPNSQPNQLSENVTTTPRLTIANNLLATTTDSGMSGLVTGNGLPGVSTAPVLSGIVNSGGLPVVGNNAGMGGVGTGYGQNWLTGNNPQVQQNYQNNFMSNSALPGTMAGNLTNTMRPQIHAPLPPGYRPSPPPRIRGRPPLIGHVGGRPPMMRGPGRPSMSLLGAAQGRGSMMPPLQRLPHYGAGQRGGQKRSAPAANQSPSKLRREDINVPARQKDNECQIIAVQNRADGIGVISNIQGGSSPALDDRGASKSNSTATTSESTIHLSDSITLSVRSNATTGARDGSRSEKGGEAGVVANLLASRGITVSPAAGEKEGGGGTTDQRKLPTASDLNLSSAISVHPPTSRDRDGFAVPHPPSAKNSSGSSSGSSSSSSGGSTTANAVDRPPRPPTVDLTQEVSSTGSQATRAPCSQCDRTFPNQALLADHAKVHQQQTQSRMPFKCHLCTAGFSSQKGQQNHYQQFHQLQYSAGDLAIPVVDFRNPANVQRMARLGIRSFLPLNNLQNRGGGGIVGIPILSLENLHNGQMNLQQWGISDVLSLGPPRTMNTPR